MMVDLQTKTTTTTTKTTTTTMTTTELSAETTVGQLVAQRPSRARLFEKLGIDYCCGGKQPLREACAGKGLDPATIVAVLRAEESAPALDGTGVDAAAMGLAELATHIEQTHHAYLREELPRLDFLIRKVAAAHGDRDRRLTELPAVFSGFRQELEHHMVKEEQILFPLIRTLETATERAPQFQCGSVANPIRVMEQEHDHAGDALGTMRRLTDGFSVPDAACNTYRALMDSLGHLEADMHQHVHKENNVLFPRAIEREQQLARRGTTVSA